MGTGTLDLAGLEAELAERLRADPRRKRSVSVVLLDGADAAAVRQLSKVDDPIGVLEDGRLAVLLGGADARGAQAYAERIGGAVGATLVGTATRGRRLDGVHELLIAAGL